MRVCVCVLLSADKKVILWLKLGHQDLRVMWVCTPGTQYGPQRLGKQIWEKREEAWEKKKNVKASAHAQHPSHRAASLEGRPSLGIFQGSDPVRGVFVPLH